jgi:hypothetical protein
MATANLSSSPRKITYSQARGRTCSSAYDSMELVLSQEIYWGLLLIVSKCVYVFLLSMYVYSYCSSMYS